MLAFGRQLVRALICFCRTYQLRIENNTGDKLAGDAMISLPARCFEASLQALHRLDMHTTMDGQLMGIQVRFPLQLHFSSSPSCRPDQLTWPYILAFKPQHIPP